jgi:tetratricopeptide (TPR) repeat protein
MMNSRYLPFLSLVLITAGCAAPPAKQAEQAPARPPQAEMPAAAPAKPRPVELPKQELTEDILYQYLMSEIAAQRGALGVATEGLLNIATATRDPRLAERATEVALQSGFQGQALEAAELWLKLDPEDTKARQTVAALLVNSGRLQEAKPHLVRLLTEEGENVGFGLLHLNQLLARHRDKEEVLKLVRELAADYSNRAEAHFAIAQAAAAAGEDETAAKEIREASRLRPGWETAALFEGQLLQRGSTANALEFYRNFLNAYPKAREVRLAYGRALVSERRYAEGRRQFEALLADFPDNPEVNLTVGLLALQLKDYTAAETYLMQALANRYRDEGVVRMYLGQLHEEQGHYDEAAQWYGSVQSGENYVTAQIRQAVMLAKQKKLAEARQHLKQIAVRNNQQRVQVVTAEAQILRDAKQYQESYDLLTKALEKLPNYPDLLYDRAMAAERIGRLDVMEQDLRKLIQLKPDYPHAYNALGYTLADRAERLDEALQLIEKALRLAPDDIFILDSMGWVQYRRGELGKAEEYLRRAYAGQPDPEIAAHLGEVLWAAGKRDEAERIWSAALKDHPDNEALLNVIKRFKQK